MQNEDYSLIEAQIGYEFNNRMLLQQAFTRKSYTNETHDGDNNEVLEFIGDKVLDLVIVKALSEYYGDVNARDEYECEYSEGKLTEIKKSLVGSKMLSARIDELGFTDFLIMGKGDRKINAQNDIHVKEDLFEAILGAVAIDSDWDMQSMQDVVEMMLHLNHYIENGDSEVLDYVSLIQQWQQKRIGELPDYCFKSKDDYNRYRIINYWNLNQRKRIEAGEGNIACELRIDKGEPFVGFGYSKSQARMVAAELAYNYLDNNGLLYTMSDEISEPSPEKAINQLQELAQKGYFTMPIYDFEETYDNSGNPIWMCECFIKDFNESYHQTCRSKKEAKKQAAYQTLLAILESENGGNR